MPHLTTGRITCRGWIMGLAVALGAAPLFADFPVHGHLPLDMPARSVLASKPKKVFAHYFPPFIQKINNNPPNADYYALNYLEPLGEGGIHAAYGGLLRQRPLARAPLHLSEIDNMGRSDMRYEVRMARAIGLDGFAVDILDYQGQHWERVQKMFDAAAEVADDFKILIMPDMNGPIGDSQADVIAAIRDLAGHPAAFTLSDKVVVAPYRAENESPTWWSEVQGALAGEGIHIVLWPVFHGWNKINPPAVVGNTDLFKNIIRGTSEWGSHSPTGALNLLTYSVANQVFDKTNATGQNLLWMSPANPHSVRNKHFLYTETRGSETYLNFWKAARGDANNRSADWVQIVTWNDQGEGTVIQPSTRSTHAFYDLTAYYTTWFKMGGSRPTIKRDTIYAFYRSHATDAEFELGDPQTKPFNHTDGSSPKNEIELLAFLKASSTLQIVIGGQTHSTTKNAGIHRFRVPLAEGKPTFRIKRNLDADPTLEVVQEMEGWFEIDNNIQVQNLVYNAMSSRRLDPSKENKLYLSHWWRRGNYNPNLELTSSEDRSPHERKTNDQAARYTDTSSGGGGGAGLGYSFLSPGVNKTLTVTFDFKIIDVADNSLTVTASLIDATGKAGNFLELFHDYGPGHSLANKVGSTPGTPITGMNVSLGSWYRVQMIVSDIEDGSDHYTVKLTPPSGPTLTSTPQPFREQLNDITGVRFIHNGTGSAKGGFLIDNVHVKAQ